MVKLLLGEMSEAHLLWEVKPQQPIGILVGATSPGMVRLRKVHLELVLLLHLLVITHLNAIVECQCFTVLAWDNREATLRGRFKALGAFVRY